MKVASRSSGNSQTENIPPRWAIPVSALILASLLSAPIAANQEAMNLTLQYAINLALTRNRDLRQRGYDVQSRRLSIAKSESEFDFRLIPEIDASSSLITGSTTYSLKGRKKFLPGTEVSVGAAYSNEVPLLDTSGAFRPSIEVEIQQPLFRDAGSLVNGEFIVRSRIAYKNEQRRVELEKADLVVEVVRSYEDILRFSRQVESDKRRSERTGELYRLTKIREILGRANRVDVLRVEFLRDQNNARLENDREALSSMQKDFAELLGFNPNKQFTLAPTTQINYRLPSPESATETALANRLDYAEAIQNYKDSRRGIGIARKRRLPDVRLTARLTHYFDGADALRRVGLEENVWFIGLSGSTDGNPTLNRLNVEQAHVDRDRALEDVRIMELAIERQVGQHITAYERTRKEVEISKRTFAGAMERLRLARRMYELGRGESITVTDAEEAYFVAETQLLANHAEASLKSYQLSRVTGTLIASPKELKPESLGTF